MAEQLRGPFEKFVDWWQYAAVTPHCITAVHSRQSANFQTDLACHIVLCDNLDLKTFT